jgi:hypothetical protein
LKFARFTSIALLIFLAGTAILGAVPMLRDPDGEPWQMPQSFLRHSPFHSYLIPGIVLLVMNGLLGLFVLFLALRRKKGYGLWIAFQGFVLLGWLTVECLVLQMVIWPHYLYGAVALSLVILGIALWSDPRASALSKN